MSFRPARLLSTLCVTLALAVFAGCSSSDGTSPTPPVTGPTFSFTFPSQGTAHELVFTDVGSWGYHCIPHASLMTGTVIVSASETDTTVRDVQIGVGGAFAFSPASVTVAPGHRVRWTLVSSNFLGHTVTRP